MESPVFISEASIPTAAPATLAAFAAFVRDELLDEYLRLQLHFATTVDVPVMRLLEGMPADVLAEHARRGATEFLSHLADGHGDEYIRLSLLRWTKDELSIVGKMQIETADITGVNLIRKKVCGALLPRYTSNVADALAIAAELDEFIHRNETQAFDLITYFHKEVAASRQEFIERVSAAVPGTLYVFDLATGGLEYVNDHLPTLMGYSPAEFARLGSALLSQVIHPDDLEDMAQYYREIVSLADGEVRSHKYRAIHKNGAVLWLRSYDTPFRRAADGTLTHLVGFSFNITSEKEASEALREREAQLLEAQDIARIGSYVSYTDGQPSKASPVINEIFELEDPDDFDAYVARIHPADRQVVLDRLKEAYELTGHYTCTYRYNNSLGERWLDCRGRVSYNADGSPLMLSGTVQDVTQQRALVEELSEKESLYREAQAIARLGSWRYEIGADETFWSDELLRIYGLNQNAGYRNREEMRRYTLAGDREHVRHSMDDALARGEDDFHIRYRIQTPAGEMKHLYSRGTVVRDAGGKAVRVIGTVQDVTEDQAMIDRLAESKVRYKEAQALAKVGNWTYDLTRGTRYWSDEMSRIFGVGPSPGSPGAQEFAKLIHPADRQRLLQRHRIMREKPGTYTGEYRVGISAEEQRWVRMRTESVAGADGSIAALRGTVQDITAEKAAQATLLQQQTFIRKVTDLAPSIITVFDAKTGAYEFVNEGLTVLLGYEADALLHGGPGFVLHRCHPDDLPALHALAQKVLSAAPTTPEGSPAEGVYEGRYRLRNAEGEYRWLHTYATIFARADDGGIAKTLDISLDVTEQVQAEAALREQDRFVRNVTQLVPSVITVVDVDTGRYVFANETASSLLGQPLSRFYEEGIPFVNSLAHPDDVPAMTSAFEKLLQQANAVKEVDAEPVGEMQYRMRNAAGDYFWMRTLTTPFTRAADGRVQQMISISQDVTPLHEAEALLKQRAAVLQQSNQSLEEFAYVASHDLQEPLRKISTFGEMLARSEGLQGDERGTALLGKMVDSSKRMQTLINDLLDISIISRQKSFETANLSFLLREVLQTLDHKIESTGATVEADGLPDAVVIPAQIRQVFQNLISNAIKFRKPGEAPRIRISARTLMGRDAQAVGLPGHQPYCEIRFEDNGIGFSNEYAEKIFTIFQRLHGKSEYEGSGIGLAICKRIAEHHGGRIWASGEVGKGSAFVVVLPV